MCHLSEKLSSLATCQQRPHEWLCLVSTPATLSLLRIGRGVDESMPLLLRGRGAIGGRPPGG